MASFRNPRPCYLWHILPTQYCPVPSKPWSSKYFSSDSFLSVSIIARLSCAITQTKNFLAVSRNWYCTFTKKDENRLAFQMPNALNDKTVEMTKENSYSLLYWARLKATLSSDDKKKIEAGHWINLRFYKTVKEKKIAWRFRHVAIRTPILAFHVGLFNRNQCFFCMSRNPTWKNLLVCHRFDEMWSNVKSIAKRAGLCWSTKFLFSGTNLIELRVLNHILNCAFICLKSTKIFTLFGVSSYTGWHSSAQSTSFESSLNGTLKKLFWFWNLPGHYASNQGKGGKMAVILGVFWFGA